MELLVKNSKFKLFYRPGQTDYNYIVYTEDGEKEVFRTLNLGKGLKEFFSDFEIRSAKNAMHAIRYVNGKFKV